MKVAFLTRYGPEHASSRVRAYQVSRHLLSDGFDVRILAWGSRSTRTSQISYAAMSLELARWAEVVVLQKPVQPRSLIDAIWKVNPRLVVDFDDAVWATPHGVGPGKRRSSPGPRLDHAIHRAGVVTVGSHLLATAVAKGYPQSDITVLPSPVETSGMSVKEHREADRPVVGWIGSSGNLVDLEIVSGALASLGDRIRVKVVSSAPFGALPEAEFEPWREGREHEALLGFDIGIMPLRNDERSRGRCGFKAIQYMAAGLPVVASPVGATQEIIDEGVDGNLADSEAAWVLRITSLADDYRLRDAMGTAGRRAAEERFSFEAYVPRLRAVLERAMHR